MKPILFSQLIKSSTSSTMFYIYIYTSRTLFKGSFPELALHDSPAPPLHPGPLKQSLKHSLACWI